jgi:adenylate cyclase
MLGLLLVIGFSAMSVFMYQIYDDHKNQPGDWKKAFKMYPQYIESQFYDIRMRMTLPKKIYEPRIVLATIDDISLNKIGRWPWSRMVWVDIMKKMQNFGAKVMAYDVVLSEAEKSCNAESPDKLLGEIFSEFQKKEGSSVIISYGLTLDDLDAAKEIPGDFYNFMVESKVENPGFNLVAKKISYPSVPIPEILKSGAAVGFIGADEDYDGILRNYPLITNVDTLFFPSLGLIAYMKYTGDVPKLNIDKLGNATLALKTGTIELNNWGETKIRYSGDQNAFQSISLQEVLNASDDDLEMRAKLNGKIVFIGSTSFGAHDLRHTPVDGIMPGVFFHINMVKMMLDGKFFKANDKSLLYSWGILLVGSLLMILISLIKNPFLDVVAMLLLCGGGFALDTYYLLPQGYEITLFFCLFSVFGTYFWNTMMNFYFANKDKAFLKSAFGSYISPELIDEMYKSGEPPKLGGDCDVLTAYFTDIQGFSSFSEKLSAPKLVELLNEYLTAMTDILLAHQGTLDKYEGDAIVAFFGAPVKFSDHAKRAVAVSLAMQARLAELRKKWVEEGDKWPKIVHEMRMRIGVNSGEIVTGNMGSKSRMNYTMMGDSVNLTARLESSAKQYGVFTQISHFTKNLLGEAFVLRELDTIRVVGKSEPVTTYDVLGEKGKTPENLIKLKEYFEKGISLYKAQKWDEATLFFKKSLEQEYIRFPELKEKINPSKIYLERCEEFKKNPPGKDWDGVYTLTSK